MKNISLSIKKIFRASVFAAGVLLSRNSYAQIVTLFTNNFSQSYDWANSPNGTDGRFGESIISFGNGRYAVAAPRADLPIDPETNRFVLNEVGVVRVFSTNAVTAYEIPPRGDLIHYSHGRELAVFNDGRFLVESSTFLIGEGPNELYFDSGSIFLHGTNGEL
jgi:hypothetical protein